MLAAIAEFEHDLIVERTHDGLAAARARGRKGGKHTVQQIADTFGVSRPTIYPAPDRPRRRHRRAGRGSELLHGARFATSTGRPADRLGHRAPPVVYVNLSTRELTDPDLPGAQLGADGVDDPVADRHDQAGAFGDGDRG